MTEIPTPILVRSIIRVLNRQGVVTGGGAVSSREKIIDIIRADSKNDAIRKRLLYISSDR